MHFLNHVSAHTFFSPGTHASEYFSVEGKFFKLETHVLPKGKLHRRVTVLNKIALLCLSGAPHNRSSDRC